MVTSQLAHTSMAARLTGLRLPAVLLSASNDVFTNLAFEAWLYRNVNYDDRSPQLLLWRNDRCVVIGRHQNPWLEVCLEKARSLGAPLARRESGGGTVYHDLGNLNCTFLTRRSGYNRKRNLDLVCRALRRRWQLDVAVTDRENIVLDGRYKVSGTAAKLGRNTAYHHCTLLLNADKVALSSSLQKDLNNSVQSKATRSVKSEVKNITDIAPSANFENVVAEIAFEFRQHAGLMDSDIEIIYPSEEEFPGLQDLIVTFKSWDWIFGKTPQFTVRQELPDKHGPSRFLSMSVLNGRVDRIFLEPQPPTGYSDAYHRLNETIRGEKLCPQTINSMAAQLMNSHGPVEEFYNLRSAVQCLEKILNKLNV